MNLKPNSAVARKIDVKAARPMWGTYLVMRYSYAQEIGLKDEELVPTEIPIYCIHGFDPTEFLEDRHGFCDKCSKAVWGRGG